jgi:hypothetical protein
MFLAKKGNFYFYKKVLNRRLLEYLEVNVPVLSRRKQFICGSFPLWITNHCIPYTDIDIWSPLPPPEEFNRESKYAFNYKKGMFAPNVQYMKIRVENITDVLSNFDHPYCQIGIKDLDMYTGTYILVIHEVLLPIFKVGFKLQVSEPFSIRDEAINELTLPRLYKYAGKFGIDVLELFSSDTLYKAVRCLDIIPDDLGIDNIKAIVSSVNANDQYELLEHLQNMFVPADPTASLDHIFV